MGDEGDDAEHNEDLEGRPAEYKEHRLKVLHDDDVPQSLDAVVDQVVKEAANELQVGLVDLFVWRSLPTSTAARGTYGVSGGVKACLKRA